MYLEATRLPNEAQGHLQVWWNGRDITARCKAADEHAGVAWCLVRGPAGGWLCPPGSEVPFIEILQGHIEFRSDRQGLVEALRALMTARG